MSSSALPEILHPPEGAPGLLDARAHPAHPWRIARAGLSFSLLGLAGALTGGSPVTTAAVATVLGLGPGVITGPALLVLHQHLQLRSSPEEALEALVRGAERAGAIALGMAPVTLFFALSSQGGDVAALLSIALAGLEGGTTTWSHLVQAERDRGQSTRAALLASVWLAATALIALRLMAWAPTPG